MKVAVIGGGGFRTPLMWESIARVAQDARVAQLILHDTNASHLDRISAVIEGLRRERGGPPIETTTNLVESVEDADIVFCAIRVGGLRGRVIDETVPLKVGVLGQETVGPGGICFALRTVPAIMDIARVVRERAPSSWFVNFTNPAGLVTEALRTVLDDRAVGICDSPAALCARAARALGRETCDLEFDYAGLNHLGWLLAVRDGERDLLPQLLWDDRRLGGIEEAQLFGVEKLRDLGMIPNEYLVYYESPDEIVAALRRAGATRAEVLLDLEARFFAADHDEPARALAAWRHARDERFGSYMAEASRIRTGAAEGDNEHAAGDEGPGEMGYAAIASAFLRAIACDEAETLILNVANRGSLPCLDDDAVVEVPCTVNADGVRPKEVGRLPDHAALLVSRMKEVERTTIEAAVRDSRDLALQALIAHPIVPTRDVAEHILAGYLSALPELARLLR